MLLASAQEESKDLLGAMAWSPKLAIHARGGVSLLTRILSYNDNRIDVERRVDKEETVGMANIPL